ncbi:MAG: protein kinase [Archangium sp.]
MSVTTHSGETEDSTTAEVAADALDPLVGQTIDGRFRIVDVIGKGAMGKVYRAVQLPLNRAVAVKVLDSTYGAGRDESFKQRFLVEAALTAKLNHPNTVRVVDYGSTKDGLFFFAMEYLDGETLEKVLAKGPLPWHRVLSIGQQMARALREAHELGVVHRDLKPANVVLLHADDDTDFVKVLDFGLVKSFVEGHELEGRAITQQGMLMGSPPYMAPEQGEKNRADPRSDIYSLGTMLFEMLTGKPPYTGGGALEVILKHVNEPIPPIVTPSKFEQAPDALKAIVVRALAKSPMDRFQSMEELLLAMQELTPAPAARAPTQEVPVTEAAVPVVAPPVEAPAEEPLVLASPPRSPSWLLIGGFFIAAVAGVLLTWALVKPSTASKLTFHLETVPTGANVFVDGKLMGVTPIDLEQGLANGRAGIDLRLEKEGYSTSALKLSANGGRLDFSQTLSPASTVVTPAPAPVEPRRPEPKVEVKAPEPKVEPKTVEPKVEPKPVEVKSPEPKKTVETKPEPEPKNEIDKAFEAKPVKPPQVTVKPEPKGTSKKKNEPKSASDAKTDGPRPASKLDEDDAPPSPTELKRPTPTP